MDVVSIVADRIASHKRSVIVGEEPPNADEFRQTIATLAESIMTMPREAWYRAEEWREFGWSDTDQPDPEMLAVSIAADEVAKAEYAKGNKAAAAWIMVVLS